VSLDLKALQRMYEMIGNDAEVMAELLQSFLEETPLLISQMQTAQKDKNQLALGRAAHTLKSTAYDFGAEDVANLNQALEADCQIGFPENADIQINAIVQCLNLKHIELAAYGKTLAGGE
jgi:histidine phosphotransfer protein HptB